MQQHAVAVKLILPDNEVAPQTLWALPHVNDTYLFRATAWRVIKVVHSDLRPPLIYIGEPRAFTTSESLSLR